MDRTREHEPQPLDHLPVACTLHELSGEADRAQDAWFGGVNRRFEQLAGVARGELLGRSVRDVPGLICWDGDEWAGYLVETGGSGLPRKARCCLGSAGLVCEVVSFSFGPGMVLSMYMEAPGEAGVRQQGELEELEAFAEQLLQSGEELDYARLTDRLTVLAGARFGICDLYDAGERTVVTRHVAGLDGHEETARQWFGVEITGKTWPMDPQNMKRGRGSSVAVYPSLSALAREEMPGTFPDELLDQISRAFGLGEAVLFRIESRGKILGDFTFLLPAGKGLVNRQLIEMHVRHAGLYMARIRTEQQLKEQRDQLRMIVDLIPSYVFLKYADGEFILANRAIARAFGTTPEDMEGKKDASFHYTPETIRMFRENERRLIETNQTHVTPRQKMITKDGRTIWRRSTMIPYRVTDTARPVILGVSEDITEQVTMLEEIRRSRDEFCMLLDHIPTHIWYLQDPLTYGRVNRAHSDFLGKTPEEAEGRDIRRLSGNRWGEAFYANNRRVFDTREGLQAEETLRDGEGRPRRFHVVRTPKTGSDGQVETVICAAEDITVRKELEEQLRQQVYTDELTGIANRRRFFEEMERAVRLARENNTTVAVLYMDFDDFKRINDTEGHEGGDRFLVEAARRLERGLLPGGLLVRLGGDEFAVLMPGCGRPEGIRQARRIMEEFSRPWISGQNRWMMSLSQGLAICPEDAQTVDELMHAADQAMYRVKERGKAGFRTYSGGEAPAKGGP